MMNGMLLNALLEIKIKTSILNVVMWIKQLALLA